LKVNIKAFGALIFALNAWTNPVYGTVVIVTYSNKEIAVATDSRVQMVSAATGRIVNNDTYCKLFPIDGEFVFTGTGQHGFPLSKTEKFRADQVAIDLWDKGPRNILFSDFVKQWTDAARDAVSTSVEFLGASKFYEKGSANVLIGVFISRIGGRFSITVGNVTGNSTSPPASHTSSPRLSSVAADFYMIPYGGHGYALEIFNGTSKEAVAKREEWERKKLNQEQIAIKLAELERDRLPPDGDIGGPIDAVRITPRTIEWIQKKDNCQSEIHTHHAPATVTPTKGTRSKINNTQKEK
jgi:hypothetical protein